MLKYLQKDFIWRCMDEKLHQQLGWSNPSIHLKTWQDIAVFHYLHSKKGMKIAEIGGGSSRILSKLSENNECYKIDKFARDDSGPTSEHVIPGVKNVLSFMGDFSTDLKPDYFDILFSVGVVEHVPPEQAEAFISDHLRVLKPGGIALHAIDMYVEDKTTSAARKRLDIYQNWLDRFDIEPMEDERVDYAFFAPSMASNPDLTMWNWNRISPNLKDLRARAQSVSLLLGFTKKS